MADDGWLLAQKIEMEAVKTEIWGMIAENQYRVDRGETVAFMEEHFLEKAAELRSIATVIMKYR